MKYKSLFLSEDDLKKNIHYQIIAKFRPGRFNIPDDFIPRNQTDKIVLKILEKGKGNK